MAGRAQFTIRLRYASLALSVLVLSIQASIHRSQNALVVCMFAVAVFMVMMNRVTSQNNRGAKQLFFMLAVFGVSFSVLFANEISQFLYPGFLQSALIILAVVSGIGGAYMAQKRSDSKSI